MEEKPSFKNKDNENLVFELHEIKNNLKLLDSKLSLVQDQRILAS